MRSRRQLRNTLYIHLGRLVVWMGGAPVGQRLGHRLETLAGLLADDSGDATVNGEAWFMRSLPWDIDVVVDAGANAGDYTRLALQQFIGAKIIVFEPMGHTFEGLQARWGTHHRVILQEVALSDHDGTLTMWEDANPSAEMSSAAGPPHEGAKEVTVKCVRGDTILKELGIDRVGLLKIDTEGHEFQVLAGFADALSEQRLDVVQFEYTRWSALTRRWLAEYYEILDGYGYAVGRLCQRRIDWQPYSMYLEGFRRANFVAVPRGSELAQLLGAT